MCVKVRRELREGCQLEVELTGRSAQLGGVVVCKEPGARTMPQDPNEPQNEPNEPNESQINPESDKIKNHVLAKLYSKAFPASPVGASINQAVKELDGLLESTVGLQKGDSILLLGPRASGKTLAIEKSLQKLSKTFKDEFILVRLDGLFHADAKLVFWELSKQLDSILPDSEGEGSLARSSLHLTFQNIMKLFEQAEQDLVDAPMAALSHISVVFIVENIDVYASAPKQTLLYNLFDLSISSNIGVAVVGTSTRMNLPELLEKRVRSRFSQRVLTLPRAGSLQEFTSVCESILSADKPELLSAYPDECAQWNEWVAQQLCTSLKPLVEKTYYSSNDCREFCVGAVPYILGFGDRAELLSQPSSFMTLSQGLSELEWAVLICAARVQNKYNSDVNFLLVLKEYQDMGRELQAQRTAHSAAGYRVWEQNALRLVWERMQGMDLLVPAEANAAASDVAEDLKMYRPELVLQEVRSLVPKDLALYSWTKL